MCKKYQMLGGSIAVERISFIKTIVMGDGERYATLVDENGLPLFYPTLYFTTQRRNASLAYSTLVNEAASISVLLQCFHERGIDIHKRIAQGDLLKLHEIDALRDRCQQKMLGLPTAVGKSAVSLFSGNVYVTLEAEYARLTTIKRYLKFLCLRVLPNRSAPAVAKEFESMLEAIAARRPRKKSRNQSSVELKSGEIDVDHMFETIRPGSSFNPWAGHQNQIRNRLVFFLLYELGIRRGELLNLRCDDFDFSSNRVAIIRRADDTADPRAEQPLVKTNERLLPLHDSLAKEVTNYIITVRNKTPNARRHPYLFVTHKLGPTVGSPLTIAGYKKMMDTLRQSTPQLADFTGHKFRHHWNLRFSELMDSLDNPPSEAVQDQMRSNAMGWRQGSGTAAVYNKRFIERKAHEAGMNLQEGQIKLPRELPL
ncbi:site-specific integrase [Pseudomonas fragi]|uniref:Site-specific integrase n=3 Tax=Pseudomonas fragi TaxID=296 RepID=A0A9Q5B4V7_PSEFR|nr:site-specific integrase [Pseudomonas fragi]NNB27667.1 site-specific integrase [Pseudomonas fragi]NNB52442.1 site-specific integrase [Pseudomonas fragi]